MAFFLVIGLQTLVAVPFGILIKSINVPTWGGLVIAAATGLATLAVGIITIRNFAEKNWLWLRRVYFFQVNYLWAAILI